VRASFVARKFWRWRLESWAAVFALTTPQAHLIHRSTLGQFRVEAHRM
jgi:hypothetical protein